MDHVQYGISHPALPAPIPLHRAQAQAVTAAWPEATQVSRTSHRRKGVTGTWPVWTEWAPVPEADASGATPPSRPGAAVNPPPAMARLSAV